MKGKYAVALVPKKNFMITYMKVREINCRHILSLKLHLLRKKLLSPILLYVEFMGNHYQRNSLPLPTVSLLTDEI
jgi:hypothetical protein